MEIAELRQLIRWLEAAGIGGFEVEGDGRRLRLSFQAGAGPVSVAIDRGDAGSGAIVTAGLPGTFLIRHPLSAAPLLPLGGRVSEGDTLGLIEVGPVYVPVTSPGEGSLGRILAVPETPVGFGTPLFEIYPVT